MPRLVTACDQHPDKVRMSFYAARMHWFDGHLDLACLAELGRDLTRDLATCGGPLLPAVTFPSLAAGGVNEMHATIFTEADGTDAVGYPASDAEAAHARGVAQLNHYHRWHTTGQLHILFSPHLKTLPRAIPAVQEVPDHRACLLLMECADPIRTPEELPWWVDRGVAAIGLAWARGSRYASGNAEPGCHSAVGLTDEGVRLVRAMDELGVVHDVSHLSDRAFDELLSLATGPLMASHSNSRALLQRRDPSASVFGHRHLTDGQIREIDRRGGVIGLNLFSRFIRSGVEPPARPSVSEAIDHVEHICSVVGHRRAVALGSDLDGGLTAEQLPAGIDSPAGFVLLADELRRRGWNDTEVEGFAFGNWQRFWNLSGPGRQTL